MTATGGAGTVGRSVAQVVRRGDAVEPKVITMIGLVHAPSFVASRSEQLLDGLVDRFVAPPPLGGRVRDHLVHVFIVAVSVLLALGMTLAAGIAVYCIHKGYRRVAWYGPNGWKVWQMKVACRR